MTLRSTKHKLPDHVDHRSLHRKMITGPDEQFYSATAIQVVFGVISLSPLVIQAGGIIRYDLVGWLR